MGRCKDPPGVAWLLVSPIPSLAFWSGVGGEGSTERLDLTETAAAAQRVCETFVDYTQWILGGWVRAEYHFWRIIGFF